MYTYITTPIGFDSPRNQLFPSKNTKVKYAHLNKFILFVTQPQCEDFIISISRGPTCNIIHMKKNLYSTPISYKHLPLLFI